MPYAPRRRPGSVAGAVVLLATLAGPTAAPAIAQAPAAPATAIALPPVDRNVIYGMYSGGALLLDVHRPARPNGYGIVFIAGSGWQAAPGYDATPLKETQINLWGPPLV